MLALCVSVEECSLAVGELVGYDVKFVSRMNNAIVIFLDSVVDNGVVVRDTLTPVLPLVNPMKR